MNSVKFSFIFSKTCRRTTDKRQYKLNSRR